MRFFKVHSELRMKEILDKFDKLSELESHNIFTSFFETYYSSRIGIHSYSNGNRVRGYYETGKRYARGNRLISQKNWFFLTVNETSRGTIVKGIIIGDIVIMSAICSSLLLMLINCLTNYLNINDLFELLLVASLCGLVFYEEFKTQIKLYDEIISLINGKTGDGSMS